MQYTGATENVRALIPEKNVFVQDNTDKYKKRKRFSKKATRNSEAIAQQELTKDYKRCLLPKRKSPTPKQENFKEMARIMRSKNDKNYVIENIRSLKKITTKEKPHIIQDSCDGHREDLNRAGLELKYVFKKEYGRTPTYINKTRHLLEKIKNTEQDANKEVPEQSMRYVDQEEKEAVLNGLKRNLKEAEKKYISLPIVTDTLSKRNRKIHLENLLIKLQQDIETLEKHDIIIIND